MRVLITGISGFVGGHIATALLPFDCELHGTTRQLPGDLPPWVRYHLPRRLILHPVDPLDRTAVAELLNRLAPDQIYHLAGYANAGKSFADADAAWAGNLAVTRILLEAAARLPVKPRILMTTTGLLYGDPLSPTEIFTEDSPMRPASPYAASKAAADLLGYQMFKTNGLEVIRARPFNQIGPGQSADYAVANFARQIAAIEAGKQPPILETGNLSGQRDLTDVRDMAYAFIRLMAVGIPGEAYNCATGTTYSMREIVDRLVGMASVKVDIREKIDESRRTETLVSRADVGKLRRTTGWAPVISLELTLQNVLDHWRERTLTLPA